MNIGLAGAMTTLSGMSTRRMVRHGRGGVGSDPEPEPKKDKTWLIAIGIAVLLFAAFAIPYFIMKQKGA